MTLNGRQVSIGGFRLPVPSTAPAPSPPSAAGPPPAEPTWRTLARDRASDAWGRIREWAEERFLVPGTTLKRRDHARWQRATSVPDLGELTARWLSGEIASSPGYYGPVDVDEDEAPGLTQALVALNRIGLWTRTSQAGADGEGYAGSHWTQLAAVDGFADQKVIERLEKALASTRYRIQAHPTREQGHEAVVVTCLEGQAYTRFGGSTDDEDLDIQVAGIGERAAQAVRDGAQAVIWDPVVGSNNLWLFLSQIAQPSASAQLASQCRSRDQHLKEAT